MSTGGVTSKTGRASPGVALGAALFISGCVGLPGPDGFEAALIKQTEGMPVLAPGESKDEKGLVRNGLLLNPAVREAASLVSASADQVRVQRSALFPSLSFSAGGGVGTKGNRDTTFELSGSQLVFDGGNSQRAVKVADFDLQIAYVSFQKAVDDAAVELLEAYNEVQTRQELLGIYRSQHNRLRDLAQLVTARTENGAVSTSDLLEARKRMQAAAFLVNDAELALGEARDRLVMLSGQSEGGPLRLTPSSCEAKGDADTIKVAQLALARARVSLEKAEKAARIPTVSLNPVIGGEIGINKLPVGLNLDIESDLLQGGALTAKANVARNNLEAALAKLGVAELEDHVAQRALQRSLAVGAKRTDMLQKQIALLSQTRKLYRSQYFDLGTRQLSDLLDNEEEYYGRQAELAELRSEIAGYRLKCALRSRVLRKELGIEGFRIYDLPLAAPSENI